jgi:MFS family permease
MGCECQNPTTGVRTVAATDRRLVIAALGLSQIIGYGTLYYAYSVVAPGIATDLGWPRQWVFGALSAALLAGGVVAPAVGRWADRAGAGLVMTVGSLAAAVALAATALMPGRTAFVLGLVAVEMASTLVQYSAAFVLLVQLDSVRAPRNITYLTLIAGFASTIFWPVTAVLHEHLSWREIFLLFALLQLLVCLPIHAWLWSIVRPLHARAKAAVNPAKSGAAAAAHRPGAFRLMAVGFALLSFVNSATLVHMLPALGALGLGAVAVLIGTLFGPAQVVGRLLNMIFGNALPAPLLAVVSAALQSSALVVLLLSAPTVPGAVAFAIVFGFGSGLASIVQGTLPLYLFGPVGYGALAGRLASIRLILSATAPFVFAFLMESWDVHPALAVTAAMGGGAVVAFLFIARLGPADAKLTGR